MKKFVIFTLISVFTFSVNAKNHIDVFGADPKTTADLLKNYGSQVSLLGEKFLKKPKANGIAAEQKSTEDLIKTREQLSNKIKQHYGFAYIAFEGVLYPENGEFYTTIEIISKEDKARLRFIDKKITKPSYPKKIKNDLITQMIGFQTDWFTLFQAKQLDLTDNECPGYHCLPGLRHPKLKERFDFFNANAIKEKNLIYRTINHDPNPKRREGAVALIGYFDDPKEIISVLKNHVNDPNPEVRNIAMMVINTTMRKGKIHEIDVMPFLSLLDSPYAGDRNQAIYILLDAATAKESKELIIRHGKERLIALLRLTQPNIHDGSYSVLKEISGKDFGPRNYAAWEKWFVEMNSNKG